MDPNLIVLQVDEHGIIRVHCPRCGPIGLDLVDLGPLAQPIELWREHVAGAHAGSQPAGASTVSGPGTRNPSANMPS